MRTTTALACNTLNIKVLYGGDNSGANICVPGAAPGEWRWDPLPVVPGTPAPPDRSQHAALPWGGSSLVVAGGAALDGSGELSDVWVLRKQGPSWAWAAPARHTPYVRLDADGRPAGEPAPPTARASPALAMLASELLVLGGEGKDGLVSEPCTADLADSQVSKCL